MSCSNITLNTVEPQELQYATNRFEESNLLGTVGFGSVYRGQVSDGMIIAVKVNLPETVFVLGPTSLVVVETVVDDGVPAGGRKMLAPDLTPAFSPGSDPPGEPTGSFPVASLRAKATTKKKNQRERAQTERRLTMTIRLGRTSSRGAIDYSKGSGQWSRCPEGRELGDEEGHGVPISVEEFDQQKRRGGVDLAHKSGSEDRGLSVVSLARQPISAYINTDGEFKQYTIGIYNGNCRDSECGYMRIIRESDFPKGPCGILTIPPFPDAQ
ncbi:hypothetical protein Q3G72_012933 [Acer saccharum]|nr:hypothetical protein Q3G72_012933 [Acer saccharum]